MKKHCALALLFFMICLPLCAQTDVLNGLKMGVIGDSYVKNHREPMDSTWHFRFAKKHGMEYYNYGRNGNCISIDRAKWGEAMYKRYKTMRDDLDLVVVIAGHNDASLLDSMGIDVFKEKLDTLCVGLIEKFPKARILFFTPWTHDNPDFKTVVDAMKEVCGDRGIPVFDAYRYSNIFARSDAFRNIYFQGGARDHAHLNGRGHRRFLPMAEKFILNYF